MCWNAALMQLRKPDSKRIPEILAPIGERVPLILEGNLALLPNELSILGLQSNIVFSLDSDDGPLAALSQVQEGSLKLKQEAGRRGSR
jgi:hypothetical protein